MLSAEELKALVAALPKAEIHLHVEGTLQPELRFELASRNHVEMPYTTAEELRAAYKFDNLDDFLKLHYDGQRVLQRREDFSDLAYAYVQRARADRVVYVEACFDPQGHLARGVSMEAMSEGLFHGFQRAEAEFGVRWALIFSFHRHLPEAESLALLTGTGSHDAVRSADTACAQRLFAERRFIAVGLDSWEVGHPPEDSAALFAYCRDELHVPFAVAHAGEEGPASYIKGSLDALKVDRIDHGVACRTDAALREELKARQICLAMCPYSNVDLGVFATPQECAETMLQLLREGLRVSLNSDDPAYFGGGGGAFVNAQYDLLIDHAAHTKGGAMTAAEVKQIVLNSFLGSFLPDADKKAYCDQVEEAYNAFMSARTAAGAAR